MDKVMEERMESSSASESKEDKKKKTFQDYLKILSNKLQS